MSYPQTQTRRYLIRAPFDPLIHSTPDRNHERMMYEEFQYQFHKRLSELTREINRYIFS